MKTIIAFFIAACSFLFADDVFFIGIAGGTGSGKTTIAEKLFSIFKDDSIVLSHDNYYKSLDHLPMEEREKNNFDHPDSIDFDLFHKHLLDLKNHKNIEMPIYDFATHSRKETTITVHPKNIVIIEGILLFVEPKIRDLFNVKIFVDTNDGIRLLRRLDRDIKERGRSFESVKKQYLETVYPMHYQFVEPTKRYADFIIQGETDNSIAIEMLSTNLFFHINQQSYLNNLIADF